MNTFIWLAEISDVMQRPHPVFGIPIGVGVLILVLYQLFKTPESHDNNRGRKATYYDREIYFEQDQKNKVQHEQAKSELEQRMEEARQKAIKLGLAKSDNVNWVINNMPTEEFQKHFSEFRVSRGFFGEQPKK